MLLFYLVIGVALAFTLRALLTMARHHPPSNKTVKKALSAGGLVALLLLALRIGFGRIVSLITGIAMLLPALQQIRQHMDPQPAAPPATPPSLPMSLTEAREVLGVPETANNDDIREAHKRLMQKNHPDQGGTNYLATKINQARDLLLKQKS